MIKGISHLGVAVKDLGKSRDYYRSVFGLESSDPIIGGEGTIQVSLVSVGNTIIELLQPIGPEGVMARFLEKRGEGFHHICYEVDDIQAAIAAVKSKGLEVLGEPKPGAEGMTAFLHPRDTHGILVEFVEKED
jgi:methylmalonyl-CoA epimerase